jgi:hypothetical protein
MEKRRRSPAQTKKSHAQGEGAWSVSRERRGKGPQEAAEEAAAEAEGRAGRGSRPPKRPPAEAAPAEEAPAAEAPAEAPAEEAPAEAAPAEEKPPPGKLSRLRDEACKRPPALRLAF